MRFDSSSASPDEYAYGNYQNGQRGNYPGASLVRSGSFRETSESRMFNSLTNMSRGSTTSTADAPPLSQWLTLEPITMGDQKYTRSGELRRVLGITFGNSAEDNSFRASHTKTLPPVATEELKRFKDSILDASMKARSRVKRLDDSLQKLSKYEALCTKKPQRSDILTTDRSGGANLLKLGSLIHRNTPELASQRVEDRTKNVVQNKRVRSSVAESRAEGRGNNPSRQHLLIGRDRDMAKDASEGSDLVEEKIRRLPAGGEGWDKKMKRKRSVGTVFTRPMDSDGELKRVTHPKMNSEPGLQSSDAQGFRSGLCNGTNSMNKVDSASLGANPNVRGIPNNEIEKLSHSRDSMAAPTKERTLAKANTRLSIRDDSHTGIPGTVTKGKASRAPRTGPVTPTNSSPNFPSPSGSLDGWEQYPSMNKVHLISGANNRKRPLSSGSSSPPMAQWVGQRPQKISRTRRTNLVSPVSNLDEMQVSAEGCSPDLSSKNASLGTNGSLLSKGGINGTHKLRVKHENVSSPARLSESEESAGGEMRDSRLKDKGLSNNEVEERSMDVLQHVGSPVLFMKKNKLLNREEIVDGVRLQGRTGRGSSTSRISVSPRRDKLDSPTSIKPLKSSRPGSEKNGSKSGRPPLKKLSDRKATRLGLTPTGSPDCTGESDDDREELLAAANFASNSSYRKCSSPFWKKMESTFAYVSSEDISHLKQQLKSMEEHSESSSQGDLIHGQSYLSQDPVFGERQRSVDGGIRVNESKTANLVNQVKDDCSFSGRSKVERGSKVLPLYERVLSALLVEEEMQEFNENGGHSNMIFQYSSDDLPRGACSPVDDQTTKWPRLEVEYESACLQTHRQQNNVGRISCNGSIPINRSNNFHARAHNDDMLLDDCGFLDSDNETFSKTPKSSSDGLQSVHATTGRISSPDCDYEQLSLDGRLMMELQSLGICIDSVPDLADGEDEAINQDIEKLQKGLSQQVDKKKAHLKKITKAMEEAKELEERVIEQAAMDRLVETAYRKRLATRGSSASKSGVPKVSKHVALAFARRTLARCRRFEETGRSCFAEPSLRDMLFAVTPRQNAMLGPLENHNSQMELGIQSRAERLHNDKPSRAPFDSYGALTTSSDQDFAKTGPILNRGKKKEVLLDDVGGTASMRASSALNNVLPGGAKGKRSEREREKDIKNSGGKAGRASLGNTKGERKTKSKPKQKTAQLSTAENGSVNKFTGSTHPTGNRKREAGPMSAPTNEPQETKENLDLQLPGFENLEDLGGANQDLDTWLNFEEDGLQDIDLMGLEIPMDDLSELNMF